MSNPSDEDVIKEGVKFLFSSPQSQKKDTDIILEPAEETTDDEPDEEEITVIDEAENLLFLEQKDFVRTTQFTPRSDETNKFDRDLDLPYKGRGRIENYLIIADNITFDVRMAVDNNDVVNDSFSRLEAISNELTHVSAYQRDNQAVVNITEYPFEHRFGTRIRPRQEMRFELIRIEVIAE